MKRILVCQEAEFPDTYLGLPLFSKRLENNYWNNLLERIQHKLVGWKGKLLSNFFFLFAFRFFYFLFFFVWHSGFLFCIIPSISSSCY